jgi:hypothetical protein
MSKTLRMPRKQLLTLAKTEILCKELIIGCSISEQDCIRALKMAVREMSGVSIDAEHAKKIIDAAYGEIEGNG